MACCKSLVLLDAGSCGCIVLPKTQICSSAAASLNLKALNNSSNDRRLSVRAQVNSKPGYEKQSPATITGLVLERDQIFNPSETSLELVPSDNKQSLARQLFSPSTEDALNDAINVAYSMSYVFHSMWTFFDRDNIGLPGLAEYFKYRSDHERHEAHALMEYQNMRGGAVQLKALVNPHNEFFHSEKGEALHAMELALSMEKLQNVKYQALHKAAEEVKDPDMCDYVVKNYIRPQSMKLKRTAKYVSQLRRVDRGHGVYHFDAELLEGDFKEHISEVNTQV